MEMAWYPGRISWIYTGSYVDGVPLAPRETYYCHFAWGGSRAVVVSDMDVGRVHMDVRSYAYAGRAVVVDQNHFYGVNNYRNVRVTNINTTTIINNYHAAPVINNTVITNYSTRGAQRFSYANIAINEKPHAAVLERIRQNQQTIRETGGRNAAAVVEQARSIPQGRPMQQTRVQQPRMTNYIVPSADVNRPRSQVVLQQTDVRTAGKGAGGLQKQPGPGQTAPSAIAPARPAASGPQNPRPTQSSGPESAPANGSRPIRPTGIGQAQQTAPQQAPKPQAVIPAGPVQLSPPNASAAAPMASKPP